MSGGSPAPDRSRRARASASSPASRAEARFLDGYDPSAFPRVAVTVDIVVLTIRQGRMCILLVRRGDHPHRGAWALPGGFVRPDEDLNRAALRETAEETGLDLSGTGAPAGHLEQLAAYGEPARDPRMRVVSVAHLVVLPDLPKPTAGDDAASARFWPVEDLDLGADRKAGSLELAFDHHRILADGVARARAKLESTSLATSFVEPPFTLAELRRVYEAVWGAPLHRQNFSRKVLATPGFVRPAGGKRDPLRTGGRPAELYRAGPAVELRPPLLRPKHCEEAS